MPSGSYVQYDYPVSRDDNAASVLETIYNPYPTKVQDGRKPEGTFTFATARVPLAKIAEFVTASDDVLDDCSKVANRIDFFLNSSLLRERDRQLIAGTGTDGQMFGLLTFPGTLALDGTTITTGVTTPNIWDKLTAARIRLQRNCAQDFCVIINPADELKVATAKDTQGNYLFPQGANCDSRRVGCFDLKVSPDIPVGTAVIGELRNNWIWFVRKALEIRMGLTGDQFIDNAVTFLGELRGTAILLCPQKVAVLTNI